MLVRKSIPIWEMMRIVFPHRSSLCIFHVTRLTMSLLLNKSSWRSWILLIIIVILWISMYLFSPFQKRYRLVKEILNQPKGWFLIHPYKFPPWTKSKYWVSNTKFPNKLSKSSLPIYEFLLDPLCLNNPCEVAFLSYETTHLVCHLVILGNDMVLSFPWHHQHLGIGNFNFLWHGPIMVCHMLPPIVCDSMYKNP